jgi:hypothetical protein
MNLVARAKRKRRRGLILVVGVVTRREWPVVEQRAVLYGSAATLRGLCLVVVTGIPATAQSTGNLHKAVSCKQGYAWVLGRFASRPR